MSSFSVGRKSQLSDAEREKERQTSHDRLAREAVSAINEKSDGLLTADLDLCSNPANATRTISVFLKQGKTRSKFAIVNVSVFGEITVFTGSGNSTAQKDHKSIDGMLSALGWLYEKNHGNS